MTTTYKFRPDEHLGPYMLKCHRRGDYTTPYKWRSRWRMTTSKRAFLTKLFAVVHHYSAHSSPSVAARWKQADTRLNRRFGNSNRASRRFINEYTAHAWA